MFTSSHYSNASLHGAHFISSDSSVMQQPSSDVMPSVSSLFLLAADTLIEMLELISSIQGRLIEMNVSQWNALAEELSCQWGYSSGEVRVSIVAANSDLFQTALLTVHSYLKETPPELGEWVRLQPGIAVGFAVEPAKVGFVFPGQGSQQRNASFHWFKRYEWVRDQVDLVDATLEEYGFAPISPVLFGAEEMLAMDGVGGEVQGVSIKTLHHAFYAQLATVVTSVISVEFLRRLGICPSVLAGHSVGELAALAEAGAMDVETLIRLVAERGQSMGARGEEGETQGGMVCLMCSESDASEIVDQVAGYLTVACVNSTSHVVLAGDRQAIQEAIEIAEHRIIKHNPLFVENAFHSRLMAHTAEKLRSFEWLNQDKAEISIPVISAVDGGILYGAVDLNEYCAAQVMAPIRFVDVVHGLGERCDIVIEVGSGRLLSGFITEHYTAQELPALPIQSVAGIDSDLHQVVGMLFAMGHTIHADLLYVGMEHLDYAASEERYSLKESLPENSSVLNEDMALSCESISNLKALLGLADISETVLMKYLERRGAFIGRVIQADMKS